MSEDNKLHTGLITHIKPAIHRIKYDTLQPSPLRQKVMRRYPQIIEAVSEHISSIERDAAIRFNEDELTYIAICFALNIECVATHKQSVIRVILLCGSGIGTSQLLKSKLSHLYPEFHVWDTYPIYQLEESRLLQDNIDYVISTVPCEISVVPAIHIGPLIDQQSRQKLNQIINDSREQRVMKMATDGKPLAGLLPEHRTTINKQLLSIESAIAVAVQSLINDGIVNSDYTATILKQLEQFGSYMVTSPHVAFIHAGTDYVQNGVGFALTYFTEGIISGSKASDPAHLVITLATDHPNAHLKILEQLNGCLSNDLCQQDFLDGNIFKIEQHIALAMTKEA